MISPFCDQIAHLHQRTLIDAGGRIGALELAQPVDVDARPGGVGLFGRADDDAGGIHLIDDAGAAGGDGGAGIAGHHFFHAGADQRRFRPQQRHGLALHVGAHQGAVGVVIFQERHQGRGHRDQLLGRNVDELHLVRRRHDEVSALAAGDQLVGQAVAVVDGRVGLGDGVFRLFHRRQIDHLVRQMLVDHPAIRAFDEAIFVHPRIGRQRIDQADIGAFRRLDRADAAVMGGVHVAHFEAGTLTGQTTRAQRRHAPLMGQLRQRVLLIHELRQLRGTEEFAHRRGHRLGVDQIMRHHRVDIDRAHPLLDGALHAQQADPELVLHQLAHRAHPAVAEIVDVVDFATAVAQLRQRLEDGEDVVLAQHPHGVGRIQPHAHIHLHPAHRRQVVALRIEEKLAEQGFGRIQRRRLAGTHDPVNVDQGLFAGMVLVHRHGVADIGADGDAIDVDHLDLMEAGFGQALEIFGGELIAGLDIDFAGLGIDHVQRASSGRSTRRRQRRWP